jgi:hypothetical protein
MGEGLRLLRNGIMFISPEECIEGEVGEGEDEDEEGEVGEGEGEVGEVEVDFDFRSS